MEKSFQVNLYVALLHYPVINKHGDVIASAVTNLDLHDISRVAKTYGVKRFYVVTPLVDQQRITRRIISHWVTGGGAEYNPDRREALETIRLESSLNDVKDHILGREQQVPVTVVTGAGGDVNGGGNPITFQALKERLSAKQPYLLIFGTAWGLAESLIKSANYRLEPITGVTDYNHLSVRSAAAIILDRLLQR